MKDIGMHYEAIHACPDDHVIYYDQHEFATECLECHISRYRTDQVIKKVPHKVLHYIPIIPCLQRLFRCKNIVNLWINMPGTEVKMMLFECLQMVLHLEIWRKSGLTLNKNPVILGFLWQHWC